MTIEINRFTVYIMAVFVMGFVGYQSNETVTGIVDAILFSVLAESIVFIRSCMKNKWRNF